MQSNPIYLKTSQIQQQDCLQQEQLISYEENPKKRIENFFGKENNNNNFSGRNNINNDKKRKVTESVLSSPNHLKKRDSTANNDVIDLTKDEESPITSLGQDLVKNSPTQLEKKYTKPNSLPSALEVIGECLSPKRLQKLLGSLEVLDTIEARQNQLKIATDPEILIDLKKELQNLTGERQRTGDSVQKIVTKHLAQLEKLNVSDNNNDSSFVNNSQLQSDIFDWDQERDKLCGLYACFNALIPLIEGVYEILEPEDFPRWDLDKKWAESFRELMKYRLQDFSTYGVTKEILLNYYAPLFIHDLNTCLNPYGLFISRTPHQKCKDFPHLLERMSTILAGKGDTLVVKIVLGAGNHWFVVDSIDEKEELIHLTTYDQSYCGKKQITLKNDPNNERLKFLVENGNMFSFGLLDNALGKLKCVAPNIRKRKSCQPITTICKHGKRRENCMECGMLLCLHNKMYSFCNVCQNLSMCEHKTHRDKCNTCQLECVCEHNQIWRYCSRCRGANICDHGLVQKTCPHCIRSKRLCRCGERLKVKKELCAECLECGSKGCIGTPSGVFSYEYCYPCGCVKFGKTPQEKRQGQVFQFIAQNFPECSIRYDKILPDQNCNKFRPDVLFELPYRKLIIECDENSHKAADYCCESKRMSDLASSGDILPTVFIRFNPDVYRSPGGQKMNIPSETRLQVLKEEIDRWMDVSTEQAHYFTVIYLFYDRCERREESFIPSDWKEKSEQTQDSD